jgi:hypothetical protein
MSDLFQLVISCGRLTSIAPDTATMEAKPGSGTKRTA